VALGAAIFKPVVVGTVARVTNEGNSAAGFGIFYMMVNIGGFVGPIVAGMVRGWGWEWVFIACSGWAGVNLLIVLLFYKEPVSKEDSGQKRTLKKVLDDLVEVLGNLRFFITVGTVIVGLMVASYLDSVGTSWFDWGYCGAILSGWIVLNILYDLLLPEGSGDPKSPASRGRVFLFKKMHCSNWRFALFLLIMSGFWTSFNQIFLTMPEYIRDFVDTQPLIFGESDPDDPNVGIASQIATINEKERAVILESIQKLTEAKTAGTLDDKLLEDSSRDLLDSKVRMAPVALKEMIVAGNGDAEALTNRIIIQGRQVNPEFIVNFDAGAIVLFQVMISFFMARFHRFTTMIVGMVVAAIGIGLSAIAGDTSMIGMGGIVWIVAAGIVIFAFGEMMASPTSQEYVGRIAPENKKALYMGYYFVAVALGNLFGGILSGTLYGKLARDMQRPDLMWLAFGGIMLGTAVVFLLYNRYALPKHKADTLTPSQT
ncbi:MAG: MFS transporter, partial [Phycisphaerae bacterium]